MKPDEQSLWFFLGLAQEKAGAKYDAIRTYKKVLTIDPDNTLTLYSLAKLYEQMDMTNEAIKTYEKLLQIKGEFDDAGERLRILRNTKPGEKTDKKIEKQPSDPLPPM